MLYRILDCRPDTPSRMGVYLLGAWRWQERRTASAAWRYGKQNPPAATRWAHLGEDEVVCLYVHSLSLVSAASFAQQTLRLAVVGRTFGRGRLDCFTSARRAVIGPRSLVIAGPIRCPAHKSRGPRWSPWP